MMGENGNNLGNKENNLENEEKIKDFDEEEIIKDFFSLEESNGNYLEKFSETMEDVKGGKKDIEWEDKESIEKVGEEEIVKKEKNEENEIKNDKSFEVEKELEENFKEAVFLIEVEKIKPNPYQPRKAIHDDSLFELAQSIRKFGILQPLVVQKRENVKENGVEVYYELIAGHRRLEAAKMIGLERVPVIIREVDQKKEQLEIAVIENLQRENLSPIEVARAFARLIDEFGMTQREIALRVGKSRQAIANILRLLQLSEAVQNALEEKRVSETHARILLSLENEEDQKFLLEKIIKGNLTTRQTQLLAQKLVKKEVKETIIPQIKKEINKKEKIMPSSLSSFLKEVERHLEEQFGWNASVIPKGTNGCQVILEFGSKDDLKSFLRKVFQDEL
ncbi:ParB/RepB/Spo0J family partition protein [bacterium]|nr:ParB/RepB/Spo0J family partition protein [bacterium]